MDIAWNDLRLFLAVAETGSLSGAARQLRVGQPTVTRRLAALEYSMGATLFRRSVDGAALTAAGERLLLPAKKMAEWAGEVGRAAEKVDQVPSGVVRVTASPFISFDFLAPFAGWLTHKHPALRLEVISSMQYLDLSRGEADLALRLKAPTHEDLKVLHDVELENAVFVSRELAAKLPKKPKWSDTPWIAWAPPFDSMPPNPQLEQQIKDFRPAFTSDNFLVNVAAAEAGVGAMMMACVRHRFSRPTSLVPLKVELGPHATSHLYLVCARSAHDIPRVRKMAELIVEELKRIKSSAQ
jgi:DNA-binding transcriptional LysR family regulator